MASTGKLFSISVLAGASWLAAQTPAVPARSAPPAANTPPAASKPAAAEKVDPSQYVLGPDDQIKIWALGLEELSDKPVRITPGGDLDLPGIGQVHAAGLTVEQLKARLVQRFSKELVNPQVSIDIVDFGSQPVSVMGALNHPGVYQLRGRKSLTEVISLAEGLRQDAGSRITISRPIQNGAIPLADSRLDPTGQFSVADVKVKELMAGEEPADNIRILPHDVVTVPIAQVVYVMGEVKKPGEVALKDSETISVLQALASAEGLGPTPSPQHARIVRLTPNSTARQEIPVDLRKIELGKAEDVAMRPNDILVVPPSGPKKAALRVTEAAIQTLTGVIVWHSY
jgi:polysaccharide biosynthesis/export protein